MRVCIPPLQPYVVQVFTDITKYIDGVLTPDAPNDAALVASVLFGRKISTLSFQTNVYYYIMLKYATVRGCVAFSCDSVAEFAQFMEANGIKPVVAEVFDFKHTITRSRRCRSRALWVRLL